jgi:hypothetical protein
MNIKDKAKKVAVDEVIAIPDIAAKALIDLIKNYKRTTLVVIIIALIIWMV